jgi:cbb3-type cytochrome c oxidase subunit III
MKGLRYGMVMVGLTVALVVWVVRAADARQSTDPKTLKNPVPATAESIAKGQQVYFQRCRSCHGDTGTGGRLAPGGTPSADLTDDKWDHGSTDGEIFTTIRNGVGPKYDMDSWEGKITDEEIWALVHYIRSIGPKTAPKPAP